MPSMMARIRGNLIDEKPVQRSIELATEDPTEPGLKNLARENIDSENQIPENLDSIKSENQILENSISENQKISAKEIPSQENLKCEKCGSQDLWVTFRSDKVICCHCQPPPSRLLVREFLRDRASRAPGNSSLAGSSSDLEASGFAAVPKFEHVVLWGRPMCPGCQCSWIVETERGDYCWTCRRPLTIVERDRALSVELLPVKTKRICY